MPRDTNQTSVSLKHTQVSVFKVSQTKGFVIIINKGLLSFYYTFIVLVGKENMKVMNNKFNLIFFIDKKSLLHYVTISLGFEL